MRNRKTRPDSFSTLIADTGEKALQRALIMGGTSLIDGEVVEWLDIELPVEFSESARRRCFDLIGRTSSNKFIICELKYSRGTNNENESLKRAYEEELIVYKSLIEENYAELDVKVLSDIEADAIKYEEPSKFPGIDIDISFVSEKFAPIGEAIEKAECSLIKDVQVVDTYEDENGKSITVRLFFVHPEKTLTRDEVMNVVNSIIDSLSAKGIELKK